MFKSISNELEQDYLDGLARECLRNSQSEHSLFEFLYARVFSKKYFTLAKFDPKEQESLNQKVIEVLLYPFYLQAPNNLREATSIMPAFTCFYLTSNMQIHNILHKEATQEWEVLLTACAYKISRNLEKYEIQLKRFFNILESNHNMAYAIDFQKYINFIDNFCSFYQLVQLLQFLFYQGIRNELVQEQTYDMSTLAIFLLDIKRNHFNNLLTYIENQYPEQLSNSVEGWQMKIAQAIINHDYSCVYLYNKIDFITGGLFLFQLIECDYKQMATFLLHLNNSQRMQLWDNFKTLAVKMDETLIKWILVAKSFKKIGDWHTAAKIFEMIIGQKKNLNLKHKYFIYIHNMLAKLYLIMGNAKQSRHNARHARDLIMKFRREQQTYYTGPSNAELEELNFFLNLVLDLYLGQKVDGSILEIKKTLQEVDNQSYKRPFTQLQQRFYELIKDVQIVFKGPKGLKEFEQIVRICSQFNYVRQEVEGEQKGSPLKLINSLFRSGTRNCIEKRKFKNYTSSVLNLLTINVILKVQDPADLYLLSVQDLNLLCDIQKEGNIISKSLEPQLYFFASRFKEAEQAATRVNDYKLLGQIYEYQNNYTSARQFYMKVYDVDCIFHLANIDFIENKMEEFMEKYQRLETLSRVYKNYCLERRLRNNPYDNIPPHKRRATLIKPPEGSYYQPLHYLKSRSMGEPPEVAGNQSRKQIIPAESEFFEDSSEDDSESSVCSIPDIDHASQQFSSQLREDIKFFYNQCCNCILSINSFSNFQKCLDEFVTLIQDFPIQSSELSDQDVCNQKEEQEINRGGEAKVFLVKFKGNDYASKAINITFNGLSEEVISKFEHHLKEVIVLLKLQKSNIPYTPRIRHVLFQFAQIGKSKRISIFPLIDLYKESKTEVPNWPFKDKLQFVFKILQGILLIESKLDILHLDLNPSNILVCGNDPVIIDFGISKKFDGSKKTSSPKVYTKYYICPSFLYYGYYSRKIEVYALGACMYYYLFGRDPYQSKKNQFTQIKISEIIETPFRKYHAEELAEKRNIKCEDENETKILRFFVDTIELATLSNQVDEQRLEKRDRRPYGFELFIHFIVFHVPAGQWSLKQLFQSMISSNSLQNYHIKCNEIGIINTFVSKTYKEYGRESLQGFKLEKELEDYGVITDWEDGNKKIMMIQEIRLEYNENNTTLKNQFVNQLIQTMQMLNNWAELNTQPFVAKLKNFSIKIISYPQEGPTEVDQIRFTIVFEHFEPYNFEEFNQVEFLLEMLENMRQIHQQNIVLLAIPKLCLFQDEKKKVKLACFLYSTALDEQPLNQYNFLDPLLLDQTKKNVTPENDVHAFGRLIQETWQQNMSQQFQHLLKQIFAVQERPSWEAIRAQLKDIQLQQLNSI